MIRNISRKNNTFSTTTTDDINSAFSSIDAAVDKFSPPDLDYKKPVVPILATSFMTNLIITSNNTVLYGNQVQVDIEFRVTSDTSISVLTPIIQLQTDVGNIYSRIEFDNYSLPCYITNSFINVSVPLKAGTKYKILAISLL